MALLGSLKNGSVFTSLFSAFWPEPIRSRMEIGRAGVLVTSEKYYLKKVAPWRDQLPSLELVLLFDLNGACPAGCVDLEQAISQSSPAFDLHETGEEDRSLLYLTSVTTGKPKGVEHVQGAVVHHIHSGCYAIDLQH